MLGGVGENHKRPMNEAELDEIFDKLKISKKECSAAANR